MIFLWRRKTLIHTFSCPSGECYNGLLNTIKKILRYKLWAVVRVLMARPGPIQLKKWWVIFFYLSYFCSCTSSWCSFVVKTQVFFRKMKTSCSKYNDKQYRLCSDGSGTQNPGFYTYSWSGWTRFFLQLSPNCLK